MLHPGASDATTAHLGLSIPQYSHFTSATFTVTKAGDADADSPFPLRAPRRSRRGGRLDRRLSGVDGQSTKTAAVKLERGLYLTGCCQRSYTVLPPWPPRIYPASGRRQGRGHRLSNVNFAGTATSAPTYKISAR